MDLIFCTTRKLLQIILSGLLSEFMLYLSWPDCASKPYNDNEDTYFDLD